jgi:multicomponent Na+:H+ antiporter subunit A
VIVLLALHLAAAVVCLAPGTRARAWAFAAAAVAPAVTFGWLVAQAPTVLDGTVREVGVGWVPRLGLDLTFRLDGFGLLMGLLVSGIGTLVLLYSRAYFRPHHGHHPRSDLGRLAGLLVAFAGSMLGLVLSDGFFTLFVFWELTSVTSYLLIGIDDRSAAARTAAQRAFLVTGAGGLALLGGLVLLGQQAGTSSLSGLVADPPTGTVTTVALVLVLSGAFAKSAQFPLHFWLPGAMAAPTPVSAYLHSATMVKAGIVLVARLAPAFADVGPWRVLIVTCGGASLMIGGLRALRQQDAKLALAQGTVSQLGLIMILVGLGTPLTTYAGVAVLFAHALFKAALFLTVGIVDHQAGTRDMRRLRGLGRRLPVVAAVGLAAGASMAAIIPTFGFVTKEKGLVALLEAPGGTLAVPALILVAAGSVLTVAYSVRTLDGIFCRGTTPAATVLPRSVRGPVELDAVHPPAPGFVAAPALLAVLSVALGVAAAPVGTSLAKVATSLDPASAEGKLVLWPGFGPALGLSAAAWVLGAALAVALHRRDRGADAAVGLATRAYVRLYDGLLDGARRLTAITQSGSLPAYLGVVLSTVVAALAAAWWLGDRPLPQERVVADSAIQAVLVLFTAMLSVAVLQARRRFTAALLLGGSGYGLALLYLSFGAPDLAVTQFLVETLTIVLFLLVLTRLPDRFDAPPAWVPRFVRLGLAVAVGVLVAAFALATSNAGVGPSTGADYLARSEPEAGGRNVVNVILVDFRGFDTMGEITVLAVAAVGVVNLVQVARRQQRRKRLADGTEVTGPDAGPAGRRTAGVGVDQGEAT